MTPRQFFNGLHGKYEYDKESLSVDRQLLYSALRYNASRISAGLSGKLSKHIQKQKFPWEMDKLKEPGSKYISYDKVKASLDMISE
ncbi:hypothetical protein NC796_07620 [Aliifodinibius sp. S!AR15-10]|uniref:hypothetical protein n=1 Tax=Aliifodinibius sp. S!AR15-10 TaxID=2950437 RepID=UPI00285ABF89|nr:hypothetical protein [Aliifodinibius sp. S!AR15-10]MDR8391000.1 hypothetical protein [Aliifodinibius sp. S!AR15-10]